MMFFAFLTNKRVGQFLSEMRRHEIPRIGLKEVLTEHNIKIIKGGIIL